MYFQLYSPKSLNHCELYATNMAKQFVCIVLHPLHSLMWRTRSLASFLFSESSPENSKVPNLQLSNIFFRVNFLFPLLVQPRLVHT